MPVHASPPARLDLSLPSECRLGPRFGYNLEIDQSIGPSSRDPDVAHGTFETCRRAVMMSAYRGRLEVIGTRPEPKRMTPTGRCTPKAGTVVSSVKRDGTVQ